MLIDDYIFYTNEYKRKYGKKTVVLMQVGSFFEFYSIIDEADADIYKLTDICNITATRKNKTIKEVNTSNPLMAGFPLYAVAKFQNILLQNNYTIVMIEQVSEPPNPQRKVTDILSPGMNVNINSKKSNYMMVIYYEKINNLLVIGVSLLDISTGKCFVYEAGSKKDDIDYANNEVFRLLISYNPCEIIFLSNETISESDKKDILYKINITDNMLTHYLWNTFEYIDIITRILYQEAILKKVYKNIKSQLSIIELLNLEFFNLAKIAFCCLLQFAYNHNADIINDIQKPDILESNTFLNLEYDSILQLNLISLNNNDKPLIDILNRCKTAFGSRLFKERLLNPIIDKKILNDRYDNIDKMLKDDLFKNLSKYLNKILDLERIKRKIIINKINPHEWNGFNLSLENIVEIFELLDLNEEKDIVHNIIKAYDILNLDNSSKYNINDIKGNIFNKGIYIELDNLEQEYNIILNEIYEISNNISKLGNAENTLCKIEHTDKEGYYIYITKKRYENLKENNYKEIQKFKIISTNQGYYKLSSNKLLEYSNILTEKSRELSELSEKYYKDFLNKFISENIINIDIIINKIANIDIYCCNARNAYEYRYYKPNFLNNKNNSGLIKGNDIRHPIIERINENIKYIGNDIELSNNGILLYGINASGKSSLMKTIGLNIIMAQSGMYVPSYEMYYEPYHHIFTRISGADNIYKGLSSFTVEMTELRNILNRCDKYSLVLGDEICNGTESISGISIVASAIDKLIKKSCSFIFATHLHELTDISIIKTNIDNNFIKIYHLHVKIDKDIIYYERKIKEGKGSSIYGIEVCKALDMPNDFLINAERIRKEIQKLDTFIINLDKSHYNKKILLESCSICNNKVDDTHHIDYQVNSDNNGFFQNYHKNIKHNLVPLCKKCHQKEHNNEISIKGFIETTEGIKLNVDDNKTSTINNNYCINDTDNDTYKLSNNDIEKIKKYILFSKQNKWYLRKTKTSKFKICESTDKILNQINNILKIKLNFIPNNLNSLLIDNTL